VPSAQITWKMIGFPRRSAPEAGSAGGVGSVDADQYHLRDYRISPPHLFCTFRIDWPVVRQVTLLLWSIFLLGVCSQFALVSHFGLLFSLLRIPREREFSICLNQWSDYTLLSSDDPSVGADQLRHVQKGCLKRRRDDLRSDGSRTESTHKR
jgi:hypothetical protein